MYLLNACPESDKMTNKKGQTPLHLACSRYDVCPELIQELIRLNSDACKTRDWQGRLPVHSACMWKADAQVIEMLLEAYPQSVREQDSHHHTPYGICRKVVHLDHHDPTVKLLRSYRLKHGDLLHRSKDFVTYQAENLSDSLGIHAHKSLRYANAG
jgi:ankyrin repeat protein